MAINQQEALVLQEKITALLQAHEQLVVANQEIQEARDRVTVAQDELDYTLFMAAPIQVGVQTAQDDLVSYVQTAMEVDPPTI